MSPHRKPSHRLTANLVIIALPDLLHAVIINKQRRNLTSIDAHCVFNFYFMGSILVPPTAVFLETM
ncbi:hypothetical protein Lalb_Chr07g0189531 [Lupinus albus]|uniref:Uncharacterized protein n=1 Tax=Lupinus albus TaxID=3870 RepID=A0A6A4QAS4_LUPAL|nr:hypothetical protein Lalb_Chr07g0189531 [Lupinus albus]